MINTALSKTGLKTSLLEAMYNEILSNSNTYYYFIGQTLKWSEEDRDVIDVPISSAAYETLTRNEIIYLKKITSSNISFVIKRYDWIENTIFDQYDDRLGESVIQSGCVVRAGSGNYNTIISPFASTLFDRSKISVGNLVTGNGVAVGARVISVDESKIIVSDPHTSNFDGSLTFTNVSYSGATSLEDAMFYCVTSDLNVYKCLYNNNNSPSTVKPYGNTYELLRTSDGYIWKYMYTIPTVSVNRFMSVNEIPVTTALNNQFYSKGSISSVTALSYGSGYTDVVLRVLGDGRLKDNAFKITSVEITSSGSGYDSQTPPKVTFEDPFSNIVTFETQTPYNIGQYIKVEDTAFIYEVMTTGVSGSFAPTHTSTDFIQNGTLVLKFVGKTPTGTAVVSNTGEIQEINLTGFVGYVHLSNPGSGYKFIPQVLFSDEDNTIPAAAEAEIFQEQVTRIRVTNRGAGYSSSTASVIIEPPEDGTTATANVELYYNWGYSFVPRVFIDPPPNLLGEVFLSDVINGGSYSQIPSVTIQAPISETGVQATAIAIMEVDTVTINTGGTGWEEQDTFTVILSDSDADVEAVFKVVSVNEEGSVTAISVINSGTYKTIIVNNLTNLDTIQITGENGIDLTLNLTLKIKSLFFTNKGKGYTSFDLIDNSVPTTFSSGDAEVQVLVGSGVRATASTLYNVTAARLTPILSNGQITGAIVNESGVGYTTATIEIDTGSGKGAILVPNLSYGDLDTKQSNIELMAIPGSIDSIVIINPGSGYNTASVHITITGDGTGCVVDQSDITIFNGSITQIKVTNPGIGYSYANVVITGDGENIQPAYARAVISPVYGHGKNAIKELCARNISLSTSIGQDFNQGIRVNNDYRQLGVIKNPYMYKSTERYNALSGSTCFSITGTFDLNFLKNDMVLWSGPGTGNQFRIVSILEQESNEIQINKTILVISLGTATLSVGSIVFYQDDNNVWKSVVLTDVIKPNIDKYSGDLMLIDNRAAFQSTRSQTVSIKTSIGL